MPEVRTYAGCKHIIHRKVRSHIRIYVVVGTLLNRLPYCMYVYCVYCTYSMCVCVSHVIWCVYLCTVLLVVGLFEESVTKWMDRACCHTKWKKAKCVACFPLHASLVVCLVCSVHCPPLVSADAGVFLLSAWCVWPGGMSVFAC